MTQLKTQEKPQDKNNNQLRKASLVPGIVYSKGVKGTEFVIDHVVFEKLYKSVGESTLVDLILPDNSQKKVLIHDVQQDPISHKFLHIDFYEVDLSKKVTAPVEIIFIGEAPAVKNEGGILIKNLDEVEIECLPIDLIQNIKVDVSSLTDLNSAIHVADLKVPSNVVITNNPEDVVVNIAEPRIIEEETPVEEKTEGEEGEEKPEGEKGKESAKVSADKSENSSGDKAKVGENEKKDKQAKR